MTSPQINARNVLILVIVAILVVAAYSILAAPDRRTTGERIGDAIHELPHGVGAASHELSDDKTPADKMGDAMRNAGDHLKENSSDNGQ